MNKRLLSIALLLLVVCDSALAAPRRVSVKLLAYSNDGPAAAVFEKVKTEIRKRPALELVTSDNDPWATIVLSIVKDDFEYQYSYIYLMVDPCRPAFDVYRTSFGGAVRSGDTDKLARELAERVDADSALATSATHKIRSACQPGAALASDTTTSPKNGDISRAKEGTTSSRITPASWVCINESGLRGLLGVGSNAGLQTAVARRMGCSRIGTGFTLEANHQIQVLGDGIVAITQSTGTLFTLKENLR